MSNINIRLYFTFFEWFFTFHRHILINISLWNTTFNLYTGTFTSDTIDLLRKMSSVIRFIWSWWPLLYLALIIHDYIYGWFPNNRLVEGIWWIVSSTHKRAWYHWSHIKNYIANGSVLLAYVSWLIHYFFLQKNRFLFISLIYFFALIPFHIIENSLYGRGIKSEKLHFQFNHF